MHVSKTDQTAPAVQSERRVISGRDKCSVHGDVDATARCSRCGKALCARCTHMADGQTIFCSRCMVRHAEESWERENEQRQREKERRDQVRKTRKKKVAIAFRAMLGALIAGVIAINLLLYFRGTGIDWGRYQTKEAPDFSAFAVDAALQDYAEDHRGVYPESLNELMGVYIESEEMTPGDLALFDYVRISPETYELRYFGPEEGIASDLVFTEKGMK